MNSFNELAGARTNQLGRQVRKIDELQASPVSGIALATPVSPASTSAEALGSVETAELEVVEAAQPEELTGDVADSGDAQADGSGELWPPLREVSNA